MSTDYLKSSHRQNVFTILALRKVLAASHFSEKPWKIYKRAHKKYYARVMKERMSCENVNAWAEQAAAQWDQILLQLETTQDVDARTAFIEDLREELNRT